MAKEGRQERAALAGRGRVGMLQRAATEMVFTRIPFPNDTMDLGIRKRGRTAQLRWFILFLSVHMSSCMWRLEVNVGDFLDCSPP